MPRKKKLPPRERYISERTKRFKKMTCPDNPDHKSRFCGCVRYQLSRGYSLDSAKRICAHIYRRKKSSIVPPPVRKIIRGDADIMEKQAEISENLLSKKSSYPRGRRKVSSLNKKSSYYLKRAAALIKRIDF